MAKSRSRPGERDIPPPSENEKESRSLAAWRLWRSQQKNEKEGAGAGLTNVLNKDSTKQKTNMPHEVTNIIVSPLSPPA